MSLPQDHAWTYERLSLLPEDGLRHEIIGGEHLVTPSPRVVHQVVLCRLYEALRAAAPQGLVLLAPCDIVLTEQDVVEPDLFWVAEERMGIVTETHLVAAPDLVVEVLSPSTRRVDENRKRRLYEAHGVREYWTVDPEHDSVSVYRLAEAGFGRPAVWRRGSGDLLTSDLLPKLSLRLDDLFAPFR